MTRLLMALAPLMLLVGCGGGGTNPEFSAGVMSVTPSEGVTGKTVQFRAEPIGDVVAWDWNFGDGAIPHTSHDSSPTVLLGALGTYFGQVAVHNRLGVASTVLAFTYRVHLPAPSVQSVSPSRTDGHPFQAVTFTATTDFPATDWAWSFGPGATPSSSHEASPSVKLLKPGTYSGTVQAISDAGAGPLHNFTYAVGAPVDPGWNVTTVASATPTRVVLLEFQGHLLLAYGSNPAGYPGPIPLDTLLASSNLSPSSPTDWTAVPIPQPLLDFVVVADELAFVYVTGQRVWLGRASTIPGAVADWNLEAVSKVDTLLDWAGLKAVEDRLALEVHDQSWSGDCCSVGNQGCIGCYSADTLAISLSDPVRTGTTTHWTYEGYAQGVFYLRIASAFVEMLPDRLVMVLSTGYQQPDAMQEVLFSDATHRSNLPSGLPNPADHLLGFGLRGDSLELREIHFDDASVTSWALTNGGWTDAEVRRLPVPGPIDYYSKPRLTQRGMDTFCTYQDPASKYAVIAREYGVAPQGPDDWQVSPIEATTAFSVNSGLQLLADQLLFAYAEPSTSEIHLAHVSWP